MVHDSWFSVGGGRVKSKIGTQEGLVPPLHETHSYTVVNTHRNTHTRRIQPQAHGADTIRPLLCTSRVPGSSDGPLVPGALSGSIIPLHLSIPLLLQAEKCPFSPKDGHILVSGDYMNMNGDVVCYEFVTGKLRLQVE